MSDERAERLSDVLADDKVGDFIEIGRLTVDDNETCAISSRVKRKSRGRPDHKRRADGNKEIARGTQLLRTSHLVLRHGLTERHSGSFDVAAAIAIGCAAVQGVEFLLHPREFVALLACQTGCVSGIAVQFDDIVGRIPDS